MSEKAAEKTAIFKNHTNMPQIFYDVKINGVVHDRIRILPGSKAELPVKLGLNHRKVLTETKDEIQVEEEASQEG